MAWGGGGRYGAKGYRGDDSTTEWLAGNNSWVLLVGCGGDNCVWAVAALLESNMGSCSESAKEWVATLLKTRLLSLTLVLTIGFLLLVSFLLTALLSALVQFFSDYVPLHGTLLRIADISVSFVIITGLFAAVFKVLPDVHLPWREALYGSAFTAVLFIVGKYLIAIYITQTGASSAYGAAGSLVAILIWVNYSGLILLFGVQITKSYARENGVTILPKSTAVKMAYHPVGEDI